MSVLVVERVGREGYTPFGGFVHSSCRAVALTYILKIGEGSSCQVRRRREGAAHQSGFSEALLLKIYDSAYLNDEVSAGDAI